MQLKNEHLNSNQHLSMQVLRLKELERQQQHPQHAQSNHNKVVHNGPTESIKKLTTKTSLDKIDHSKHPSHPTTDCCILAHREYFEISAFHSKIIERSVMSGNELKTMKLKQSAIKLDNRKSNQSLKQLKTEIDKKQTYLTELSKNITASNEQFNMFKRLVQVCGETQTNVNQAIYLGNVNTGNNAKGADQVQQTQQYQVQENQTVTPNPGANGTVYFINQPVNCGGNVNVNVSSSGSGSGQQAQQQVYQQQPHQNNVRSFLSDLF